MKQNLINPCAFPAAQNPSLLATPSVTCIALHKLLNQVIAGLSICTLQQTDLIVNNVQKELLVSSDRDTLSKILNNLLATMLWHGQNNVIQVSAKLIGSITLIHIKTVDTGHSGSVADSLHRIQPMAQSLGGCVTLSNSKIHGIDLAFTFINR